MLFQENPRNELGLTWKFLNIQARLSLDFQEILTSFFLQEFTNLKLTSSVLIYMFTKAYIPLQRKTTGFGASHWVRPPKRQFCVTYTNMLVSKNTKICVTPKANPKFCVIPNTKPQRKPMEYRLRWVPNTELSHWPCRFHVVYPFFFTLGTQLEGCSQWNMGLTDHAH